MQTELPLIREGRYGTVVLDHAACGRGYVVDFRASEWVRLNWGDKSRWQTFESFQAALAFFWGLSGFHERREAGNEAGGRVKGSRNAVRTTLDAPEASKLLASLP